MKIICFQVLEKIKRSSFQNERSNSYYLANLAVKRDLSRLALFL